MATSLMSVSMVMMIALCIIQDHNVLSNRNSCESIQGTDITSFVSRNCVAGGCVQGSCYPTHVSTELDQACMDYYNTETDTQSYECCEYSATSCSMRIVNGNSGGSVESPFKRFLDRTARRQQRRQRYN